MRAAAREGTIPPTMDVTQALGETTDTLARARELNRLVAVRRTGC